MVIQTLRACVFAFISAQAAPACAMEITEVSGSPIGCTTLVRGQIATGAAQALETWLNGRRAYAPSGQMNGALNEIVCFDSLGGSFLEGVRLARVLTRTSTGVDAGHQCISACFIAFMAGTFDRMEDRQVIPDRVMHPTAGVGYHSPGLSLSSENFSADDLAQAWTIALLSVAEILNLRLSSPNYFFRDELLEDMLRTEHSQIKYIRTVGEASLYNIIVFPTIVPTESLEDGHANVCRSLGRMSSEFNIQHGPEAPSLSVTDGHQLNYRATFDPGESGTVCDLTYKFHSIEGLIELNIGRAWMLGDMSASDWWIPNNDFAIAAFMHYPPETEIIDLPHPDNHRELNARTLEYAIQRVLQAVVVPSCWLSSPSAHITNVSEYVNLRRQPDFSAPVIRQVPLDERVRLQRADNITVIGQERDRQSCINACQAFSRNAEDHAARDRTQQCIQDNMLWYEITDARGNRGWVSRTFLEEVE
jgi:hypothetical protein